MCRIAVGRSIGLLLAITGITLSINGAYEALRMIADFHAWLEARPMETAIDLSRPGEITVPFHQTCSSSHGEGLYLKCDLDEKLQQKPQELLEGLSGAVVLKGLDGREIVSVKVNDKRAQYWDGQLMLTNFSPFGIGTYVATIRIDSGAPALAGREQTIYVKYHLCGLEQVPAMVAGAFALGAGILGLVSAMCVLPGLLQYGFVRQVPKEIASQGQNIVAEFPTTPPTS